MSYPMNATLMVSVNGSSRPVDYYRSVKAAEKAADKCRAQSVSGAAYFVVEGKLTAASSVIPA